jgi:5'-AMP-activated protein kinase catalytic alpha subunit
MPLEDYALLDVIGAGAFATVHRARHIITNQLVAIKVVERNSTDSTSIANEVSIHAGLDHPLIAQFCDYYETGDKFYIVQEFAAGGSFLDFVSQGPGLPESDCKFYFLQLLSIIEYLHLSRSVVHRDLKLENLLLDSHRNLRLIDFGLSNRLRRGSRMTDPCGTRGYAAPEVFHNIPYGFEVDIWGLGVCLYAMASGCFPSHNILAEYGELSFPTSISPDLRDLIEKLLQKEPHRRIRLTAIRRHSWLRGTDLIWKPEEAGVDFTVLDMMEQLGIDTTNIERDVSEFRINPRTVAYKILRGKYARAPLNRSPPPAALQLPKTRLLAAF